jgi:predicted small integral membrane protein
MSDSRGVAMTAIRICQIALVASIAAYFALVALGNITDYESNWVYVQHVLSMDTAFPDSRIRWRAITDPGLQTFAYWLIIGWETLTAVVLLVGVARLLGRLSRPDFAAAKPAAVAGLGMGLFLYLFGFIVVAGEWFAMWQSPTWNAQGVAFSLITTIGIVLIVLILPEPAARD